MTDKSRRSNRGGLTKSDLTDRVYRRHGGLTKAEAAKVVEKIFDTMKANLVDGRPIKIQNFGVFEVRRRQGRTGVNPANGRKIFIPPHKGLSFRPAPKLKDEVDDPDER
ncbi:MAG: HU family DNA-binding protein [Thermoanaerobaculia bacterium]|nr:HU family DNA-binding protein [Thermoanaerobaculia bacterium]